MKKIFYLIMVICIMLASISTTDFKADAVIQNDNIDSNIENNEVENNTDLDRITEPLIGNSKNENEFGKSEPAENNSALEINDERKPVEEPVDKPIAKPIEDPIEKPVEKPIVEPIEKPVEEPIVETDKENIKTKVIDPNKPMIAITYDDGPSKYTDAILDVLKENNSSATFFVLGSRVNSHKDVLNKMIEEGNQIGNHSYNHKKLTALSDEELYEQIKGTDELVYSATGYTPTVVRPPYGASDAKLNKKIAKPIIKWSIDTRDWENKNSKTITNEILSKVKDGDIILMHDLYDSTLTASKTVIPKLVENGFQLVTIDEMFEYKDIKLTSGEQYYKIKTK